MSDITNIHASALPRIMACAGSFALEKPLEAEENDYAREGEAAHDCVEHVFSSGEPARVRSKARNGWVTDEDMWRYACQFVDLILALPHADGNLNIEAKAHWVAIRKTQIRCKVDAWHYDPSAKTLYITDFKYGWRIVEPKDNWQLIAYAIGVCRQMKTPPKRIVLSVYQPRPFHQDGPHRSWEITLSDLAGLHERIIERLNNLDDTLATGQHCLHCLAAPAHCPAIRTASFNAVDVVMQGQATTLNGEDHARELALMQRTAELAKQRAGWLEDLAVNRLKQGEILPGYRLKKVYGKTAWKSKAAAKRVSKAAGVKLFDSVPVTPAEAIRRGVDEDAIKEHTERPERGVKLAKGSSAKEAEKVFKS